MVVLRHDGFVLADRDTSLQKIPKRRLGSLSMNFADSITNSDGKSARLLGLAFLVDAGMSLTCGINARMTFVARSRPSCRRRLVSPPNQTPVSY